MTQNTREPRFTADVEFYASCGCCTDRVEFKSDDVQECHDWVKAKIQDWSSTFGAEKFAYSQIWDDQDENEPVWEAK